MKHIAIQHRKGHPEAIQKVPPIEETLALKDAQIEMLSKSVERIQAANAIYRKKLVSLGHLQQ